MSDWLFIVLLVQSCLLIIVGIGVAIGPYIRWIRRLRIVLKEDEKEKK